MIRRPRPASRALSWAILVASAGLLGFLPARADAPAPPAGTKPAIDVEDVTARIRWLSSEPLAGRMTTQPGAAMASQYVADEFRRLGLKPIGDDGGWFQGYEVGQPRLGKGNLLEMEVGPESACTKTPFGIEVDWNPFAMSPNAQASGALAFAGFAVEFAEKKYDDFAGLDVKGKIVLVLRREPWTDGPSRHATFVSKLGEAAKRGAAGLLLVNDARSVKAAGKDLLLHWSEGTGANAGSGLIPFAFVSRETATKMLAAGGKDLATVEAAIVGGDGSGKPAPQSFDVPGVQVRLSTSFEKSTGKNARNVVGLLEGSDEKLREEVVVVGAHHDHVGLGYVGSAGGPAAVGKIHPGADDNASGTAALLEMAEALSAAKTKPRRSILFLSFSGEELGLLGSLHYCDHPIIPLDRTVAMVNCDMVGRYDEKRKLEIGGVGTGKGLQEIVEAANAPYGLALAWDPQGVAPSDNTSFFLKKVPVLFFFTGIHPDYHTPKDTWQTINAEGEVKVTSLCLDVVRTIADRDERIAYTTPPKVEGTRAALGINLSQGSDGQGVTVTGVAKEGGAEKAGMLAGDVVTSFGPTVVKDVRDLMKALSGAKPGDVVQVKVLRNGEPKDLQVTLGSR